MFLWLIGQTDNVKTSNFIPTTCHGLLQIEYGSFNEGAISVIPNRSILDHWNISENVSPATDGGLINDTFIVGSPPSAVLQRVNPIFGPDVHFDIEAITSHVSTRGISTPLLIRTNSGQLCVPTDSGAWRLLSYLPGTTIHSITSLHQAASAATFVGQFHRATQDLDHTFRFVRPGAHDTLKHMATLEMALSDAPGDELEAPATKIAEETLERWSQWSGSLELPPRISHGDLKISNLRFDDSGMNAIGLLDLDTLSHQSIDVEMGDAWRSWCNPAGEDHPNEAVFDIEIFKASAQAWLNHGPRLSNEERENLVGGIERICLELTARFCADAINRSYFKEDTARFPTPGSHNIHRAQGQLALARSVKQQQAIAEQFVKSR